MPREATVIPEPNSPGLYRHYKGGLYVLLCVAETHHHNGDRDVVYLSCTTQKVVTRPLQKDSRADDSWTDVVMWPDGVERQRFMKFREGMDPFEIARKDVS